MGNVELIRVHVCLCMDMWAIAGCYVGRFDMWRFKESLKFRCVQYNELVRFANLQAAVKEIWMSNNRRVSADTASHTFNRVCVCDACVCEYV